MNLQGNINQLISMGAVVKALGGNRAPTVEAPKETAPSAPKPTEAPKPQAPSEPMHDVYSMQNGRLTHDVVMESTVDRMLSSYNQQTAFEEWRNRVYGDTEE